MAAKQHLLAAQFSKTLIEDMFQVKPGETIAITADFGTDTTLIDALFVAAQNAGGLPLILRIPKAENDSQAGMKDWPSKAISAALCNVDVWIEANSIVLLYSDIWETAMQQNKNLRYLIIADSSIASLNRVFTGFDIQLLKQLLLHIISLLKTTQKIRITSKNGTDVSYTLNPDYLLDYDDGDFSKPKFGTAPGFVNIVPKIGSMNGTIVFEHLQHAKPNHKLRFVMKNGSISDVKGNEGVVDFKAYLSAFKDENMYKISHNMLGFNPKIRKITGELVEDERIWGGVDFGFGHTSAMDMPPLGQPAKSHFDGVVANTSIYFDDTQITDHGELCHPKLKTLAKNLLKNN